MNLKSGLSAWKRIQFIMRNCQNVLIYFCENFFFQRLKSIMDENNYILELQFGFREHHSRITNVIKNTHEE